MTKARLALATGSALAALIAAQATAQTATQPPPATEAVPGLAQATPQADPASDIAPQGDQPAPDIVVVGTQIKGASASAALPVTVIDQSQIDATGAVSGDDLFRSIPQAGDVTFNEANNAQTSNAARGDRQRIRAWFRQPGAGSAALARLSRIEAAIANISSAPYAHPAGPMNGTRVLVRERHRIFYVPIPSPAGADEAGEILIIRIYGPGQSDD